MGRSYFHLHLVSDATGETLIAASRAVAAQYQGVASIEHVFPLVRSRAQLDRLLDPNKDVTLSTLARAAAIVGRQLRVELS